MNGIKPKKISKKAKRIAKRLDGILYIKSGIYTISLSEEEIYILLTENKINIEEDKIKCHIE